MKIIILTAGLGTRLRPHTLVRPKALLTVAGRPVLSYILDKLIELESVDPQLEFIFVNGWLGEQIVDFVSKEYVETDKLKAQFIVQEKPLGQAHAISLARSAVFKDVEDSDVLIVFADTIFDTDLTKLKELPESLQGALFVKEVADPSRFGVAVVDETSGYVTRVVEKPKEYVSNLAICSPSYFKSARQLFSAIDRVIESRRQTNGEYFLADAMAQMLEEGALLMPLPMSVWLDAGTFEALLATNKTLLEMQQNPDQLSSSNFTNVTFINPVWIDKDVIIERSVIGPHVAISKGAIIRESVIADSIVETNSVITGASIKHSIIGQSAKLRNSNAATNLNLGDYSEI